MSRRFAFDARATMAAIAARRAGSAVAVPAVLNPLQPPKPPPPLGAELTLTRPTAYRDGEPIDMGAIEERAALAADGVAACYLDAWKRPLSVTGVAPLRTVCDGWSDEDWRAFFDERAGIAEFDGGLPREQAEARAFACCVAEWLNRNREGSPADCCLRCGGAEHAHDPLLPFGTEFYRSRLASFALLVGLVRWQTGRSSRCPFIHGISRRVPRLLAGLARSTGGAGN